MSKTAKQVPAETLRPGDTIVYESGATEVVDSIQIFRASLGLQVRVSTESGATLLFVPEALVAVAKPIVLPQPERSIWTTGLRWENQGNGRYVAYDGGSLKHLAHVTKQHDERGVPSGWVAYAIDVDGLVRTDLGGSWGATREHAAKAAVQAAREEVQA